MANTPRTNKTTTVEIQQQVWSYPIPPPDIMNQYPPEIIEQFVEQWKLEGKSRRESAAEVLRQRDHELQTQRQDMLLAHQHDNRSLWLSFLIIAAFIGASIIFAALKLPIQALTGLVGALSLFWLKRRRP